MLSQQELLNKHGQGIQMREHTEIQPKCIRVYWPGYFIMSVSWEEKPE